MKRCNHALCVALGRWGVHAMVALSLTLPATGLAQSKAFEADVTTCIVKPKRVIQLGSPVFGVVGGVFVDRAQIVKQGDLLAKLDTTVDEAQVALDHFRASNTAQIDAAKTDLAWNTRELERRERLAGNLFSKANEVDEIATRINQNRIAIRKAESDLQQAKMEASRSDAQLAIKMLKSPINGVVTEIKLSPGEFIYEQTPIMTLAEVDPLIVDLVVPAERFKSVRVGQIGEVQLSAPVDATVSARVDAIDSVFDASSDTFRVRLALPNPGNAIPAGTRCSVILPEIPPDKRVVQ